MSTVKCPNPQCGKGLNVLPNVEKKGKMKCPHCGMVFSLKPAADSGNSEAKSEANSGVPKPKTPAKPQQTPRHSVEAIANAESIDEDEYLI